MVAMFAWRWGCTPTYRPLTIVPPCWWGCMVEAIALGGLGWG